MGALYSRSIRAQLSGLSDDVSGGARGTDAATNAYGKTTVSDDRSIQFKASSHARKRHACLESKNRRSLQVDGIASVATGASEVFEVLTNAYM